MQSKNKVIIAAAGSGKTTYLVEETIKENPNKTLIVTFTNKNRQEILNKFQQLLGYIPANVDVKTWYSFLLSDWIRPYQKVVYPYERIESVFFRDRPAPYAKKTNIRRYYLKGNQIDKDRIADFALLCLYESEGAVIQRLEEIYDSIFIDEVQDMSGYDLDIFHVFFQSKIRMILVGDIRQATYSTSNTNRHQKYRGINIIDYFKHLEQKGICAIDGIYHSHRCNQAICDFSDNLFPHLPKTSSNNRRVTDHDGIFLINKESVHQYRERYNPQVLRYDARTEIPGAINFGESKGLTFDRVLIKPTSKMEQYLKTGQLKLDEVTLAKFYVAVTRARFSVAFITDLQICNVPGITLFKL
ncbi:DNA helicase-2/ATP-dependent DNA helicase PcrA [Bacillus oleivorans]|uniref:DNA helicase-2/ATP-dependent DNA helicase PcrA n=1 Tax=Bacillus oleivorans TaxID=1448271 RepID=A0A285D3G9_9BACI|nr:UvrD-helicase domain-containing protein [Bacillus oleivorans]SNX74322.1 DNA helicase-2/ATP-dependent DNA helicase PcrA [Bacillus oleivorans]